MTISIRSAKYDSMKTAFKKLQIFPNVGFSMSVYQALFVISRKQYEIPFSKLAIHDDIQDRYYKDTSPKAI